MHKGADRATAANNPAMQRKLEIFQKYFPGIDPTRKNIYDCSSKSGYDELANLTLEHEMLARVLFELKGAVLTSDDKRMLDLCCGSGVLPKLFKKDLTMKQTSFKYTGVDINAPWLRQAQRIIGNDSRYSLIHGDAIDFSSESKFDAIAAVSAYHHIPTEPNLKSRFLGNIRNLLAPSGLAVIYEKLIAKFDLQNPDELFENSILFYYLRMRDMEAAGFKFTPGQLRATALLAWQSSVGEDEYKVWHDYFVNDLERCGLEIVRSEKIWPPLEAIQAAGPAQHSELAEYFARDPKAGDYVFVVKSR